MSCKEKYISGWLNLLQYNERLMEFVSSVFNIRIYGSDNMGNYDPISYDKDIFDQTLIFKKCQYSN